MAHHKSAEKRNRQNSKRASRNRSYLSKVRTAVKAVRKAVAAGSLGTEELAGLFIKAQSLLGKASRKGLVHPNAASRRVARLSRIIPRSVPST